jgi:Sec-independent protein translocase protein TatA
MNLVVLLIIFLLFGYVLADTRLGRKVDQAAEGAAGSSKNLVDRVEARWKAMFRRGSQADALRAWAANQGSDLPVEVKTWLAGLAERDLRNFTQALASYSQGLGFNLDTLVEGGLDDEPILRQVFVEAIVVYSDAYRKAKKALEEAEAETQKEAAPPDGKKPAEKQASRRKREQTAEAAETAPVA